MEFDDDTKKTIALALVIIVFGLGCKIFFFFSDRNKETTPPPEQVQTIENEKTPQDNKILPKNEINAFSTIIDEFKNIDIDEMRDELVEDGTLTESEVQKMETLQKELQNAGENTKKTNNSTSNEDSSSEENGPLEPEPEICE